jgi:DNA-binding CsgD family transcriptional regulator
VIREKVLALLEEGCSNEQIGARLGISHTAVKKRIWYMARHAGLRGSADHVRIALVLRSLRRTKTSRLTLWMTLTNREREVATLVVANHSNKEVAALLGIKTATVAKHLNAIYSKIDVSSRLGFVVWHLTNVI